MTTATKAPVKPAQPAQRKADPAYPALEFKGGEGKSVLPPELENVMLITGFRGSGKSYLAATADNPKRIVYLDYESKGKSLDKQLGFGFYSSIYDEVVDACGRLVDHEVYKRTWQILEAMPRDKYTVVVFDNIGALQRGMVAEVKDSPARWGVDQQKALTGAMGGPWPGVANIVSTFNSYLRTKGVQLVIFVAHVKAPWAKEGPVPNKFKADGVARIHELSVLSLIMQPGTHPPTPSAIVAKEQTAPVEWNEEKGEHDIRRVLPLRLPRATWKEIRRYLAEGCDFANPKPGEVPTQEELDVFSPTFSKEQIQALAAASAAGLFDQPDE